MSETQDEVVYWDCCDEAERLYHKDQEDAIRGLLEDIHTDCWPETLTVYGYSRLKLDPARSTDSILEALLEWWDEEYLTNDDGNTEITDTMRTAAKAFVEAVAAEYPVQACRLTTSVTVDVRDWVREHAPSWLEEELVLRFVEGKK